MRLLLGFLVLLSAACASAQGRSSIETTVPKARTLYWSSGSEWLFSAPMLDVNGSDRGGVVRFAPFFNAQSMLNYDVSDHAGFFIGLSLRNLGFIYDAPDGFRYKFRTYNGGIPIGFKLGRMHETLFFAGYEIELPFNYKEKRFLNERKDDKFNVWLSDRTEPFFQSVFIGVQGPGHSTLTLRYYLTNFHNTDFMEYQDNVVSRPYSGLNSNLVVVSLGVGLFDGTQRTFRPNGIPKDVDAMVMGPVRK